MDFGLFPPEINSARMYSGPGSGPLMTAAAAWEELATELHSTAASYSSVISGLTSELWLGPASASMAAAAAPYAAWMRATAAQAEQAGAQAKAAVGAYEEAFAMTVPPAVIAANRTQTMSLIATNILGQNTPAIATNEAHYGEMWAQDTAAMDGYAGSSAAASKLTPFAPPPQTANPAGQAAQAVAPAAAAAPAIPLPGPLQELDLVAAAIPAVMLASLGVSSGNLAEVVRHNGVGEGMGSGVGPALVQEVPAVAGERLVSRSGGGAPVAAFTGRAASIGGLSVPSTWAAPPAIRQLAAALPYASAAPMVVPDSSDESPYTGMALASLIGSGMGGLAFRGGSSAATTATTPGATPAAAAAAARPAAKPTAVIPPISVTPPAVGLPPGVAENLAATLAAIPGATIIVVPPSPAAK